MEADRQKSEKINITIADLVLFRKPLHGRLSEPACEHTWCFFFRDNNKPDCSPR